MSASEKIFCYGGQECSYGECKAYHEKWDQCLNEGFFISLKNLHDAELVDVPDEKPVEKEQITFKPIDLKGIPAGAHAIVEKILEVKPNLTVAAITELAESERAKAAGLLTLEAAYYLVASNLGTGPDEHMDPQKPFYEVGKYITVTGKMIDDPSDIAMGDRKNGTKWKRCNFRMDVAGETIRVTMWDDFTEEIHGWSKGDTVTLKGVRVQDPYEGTNQVSSAKYTEIE